VTVFVVINPRFSTNARYAAEMDRLKPEFAIASPFRMEKIMLTPKDFVAILQKSDVTTFVLAGSLWTVALSVPEIFHRVQSLIHQIW